MLGTSLRDLYRLRKGKRKRVSSYDPTGGNRDFVKLEPGQKLNISHIIGLAVLHISG
jgi:hypothetical protein